MSRFFIKENSINGDIVQIKGRDFEHIAHSLRLNPGDKITVSTGDGRDFKVELQEFGDNVVRGRIVAVSENSNEPPVNITLAQAVPKNRNMELVVRKCTELGISRIIPLETERTIVKLRGDKARKRKNRWQRIAREAAKQAGRGIIPQVEEIHNLQQIDDNINNFDLKLLFWTGETAAGIKKVLRKKTAGKIRNILLLVGPEGGFSPGEVAKITAQTVSLGPRILRTETAGMAALTIVLYELGGMGG